MDYLNLSEIDYNFIQDDINKYLGDISKSEYIEIHNKKTKWLKEKQKKLIDSINS
jgi:hypothetical protein